MPLKTHHDDMPQMNMTAMIDVLFFLIVYFMVGTNFIQTEKKMGLQVPVVSDKGGVLTDAPSKKVVNLYKDGTVTLDSTTVSLDELTKMLVKARSQYRDLGVVVRGDGEVNLQRATDVMHAVKKAGVSEMAIAVRFAPAGGKVQR